MWVSCLRESFLYKMVSKATCWRCLQRPYQTREFLMGVFQLRLTQNRMHLLNSALWHQPDDDLCTEFQC